MMRIDSDIASLTIAQVDIKSPSFFCLKIKRGNIFGARKTGRPGPQQCILYFHPLY